MFIDSLSKRFWYLHEAVTRHDLRDIFLQNIGLCGEETKGLWIITAEWGLFCHRRVLFFLAPAGPLHDGLLNSIKEDEVQSLLWALQPYFIHPLKISPIFEILYDTHPVLGVCIFEFSAPLLKCFSFWKITMHLSTLKSPAPWSLLCLALVWDPAGARSAHSVSWLGFFSLSQMCWYHAPVLCTCHYLCSWPCAMSESFWSLLMSQLSGHISKWGSPCSPLRPGLFWLLPESGFAGSEGVELASGKLELSLGLQIQYC